MKKEVIEINTTLELLKIVGPFRGLPDQVASPSVLKNALNSAARKVRKQIILDAKGEYAIKKRKVLRDKSEGGPELLTASPSNLSAVIRSRGPMQEVMSFTTRRNTRKKAAKARVLTSGTLKELKIDDLKAFLTTFASGHQAIVRREGAERYPVNALLSPSVPHMLGNDAVMRNAEDLTYELLQEEIRRRIDRLNLR